MRQFAETRDWLEARGPRVPGREQDIRGHVGIQADHKKSLLIRIPWQQQGHGKVDLNEAIKVSCDVYFYQIAREIGINKIAEVEKNATTLHNVCSMHCV